MDNVWCGMKALMGPKNELELSGNIKQHGTHFGSWMCVEKCVICEVWSMICYVLSAMRDGEAPINSPTIC